jgi:ABC-type sulfate/molybdate transport systems ATPase subunit
MDRAAFFEAAAEAPFLGGLSVGERRRLAELARPLAVEPGTMLLREALDRDEELAAALYPRILHSVARRLEATRLQLLDLFAQDTGTPW